MNVNRLLIEKYIERCKMKLSENILGRGNHVVEFNGKKYQEVGYHGEKGYLIICSAFPEEGFIAGSEFNHLIPIIKNMTYTINDDLFYRKVMPEEIEDVYCITERQEYCGYKCNIFIQSDGRYIVIINGNENEDNDLLKLGFESGLEDDYPRHINYSYKKDINSIDDDNVQMAVIKQYMQQKVVEPWASMKRREYNTCSELQVDIKDIYRKTAQILKDIQ